MILVCRTTGNPARRDPPDAGEPGKHTLEPEFALLNAPPGGRDGPLRGEKSGNPSGTPPPGEGPPHQAHVRHAVQHDELTDDRRQKREWNIAERPAVPPPIQTPARVQTRRRRHERMLPLKIHAQQQAANLRDRSAERRREVEMPASAPALYSRSLRQAWCESRQAAAVARVEV